jgi:hypothetical protein
MIDEDATLARADGELDRPTFGDALVESAMDVPDQVEHLWRLLDLYQSVEDRLLVHVLCDRCAASVEFVGVVGECAPAASPVAVP